MRVSSFDRWRRVLLVLTALLALQALGWALLGNFDPFGLYDREMALPPSLRSATEGPPT